ILVGVVPTAYALNRAVTVEQTQDFVAVSQQAVSTLNKYADPGAVMGDPTGDVTDYIASRSFKPGVNLALRQLVNGIVSWPNLLGEQFLLSFLWVHLKQLPPVCSGQL